MSSIIGMLAVCVLVAVCIIPEVVAYLVDMEEGEITHGMACFICGLAALELYVAFMLLEGL